MRFVASIFSICRAAYRVDLVSEIPVVCVEVVDQPLLCTSRVVCNSPAAIVWL